MKYFFAAMAAVISVAAIAQSPYVGEQHRSIKALSDAEIAGYLAGDGMGFALAAELNDYPGPKHVLELAQELKLSDEQREQTQAIYDRMKARVETLGRELVELEGELDRQFAQSSIGAEQLRSLTREIGEVNARIRFVHLEAHLEQREVLDQRQLANYSRLRGYHSHDPSHRGH